MLLPSFLDSERSVLKYSAHNLAELLTNEESSLKSIKDKPHFIYLKEYLSAKGLASKTIVIEDNYISKDFIVDFSHYHSLCYKDYKKFCRRIHFFDKSYSYDQIRNLILSTPKNKIVVEDFQKTYLGYIVINPVPYRSIGITVLKPYKENEPPSPRFYFSKREYKINFFGIPLNVQSLAFSEQDRVLGSCATTAIWSVLHKASYDDYHIILKSPSEITNNAAKVASDGWANYSQ